MDKVESALEVYADDGIPLGFGHSEHQSVAGYSGVVDKNIDTAEIGYNLFDYGFGLCEICGVGGISFDFNTESSYFFFGLLAVFVNSEVGECDVGTFCGETQCKGFADTTRGAGYQSSLSFEKFHCWLGLMVIHN